MVNCALETDEGTGEETHLLQYLFEGDAGEEAYNCASVRDVRKWVDENNSAVWFSLACAQLTLKIR